MALPAGAEPPFRVYVNGEERAEGAGFVVEGGTLRFTPPLHAQPRSAWAARSCWASGSASTAT